MSHPYFSPFGGLPSQSQLSTGRAVFNGAYAVLPRDTMRDIVTSRLPGWSGMRCWIIARPMTGFSETFAHYIVEVMPGGGSARPEPDPGAEAVLFVTGGYAKLVLSGAAHMIDPGAYVYLAPGTDWSIENTSDAPVTFHWIRKAYEPAEGLDLPESFVSHDEQVVPAPAPETEGRWATSRFVAEDDLRHDMHVNIVTLAPGAVIPFAETHVMEHGLYVLRGKGVYQLNQDWVEVEAGDYMWLRAFCPQSCYAGGPGPFRYLLYKDVNRHPRLRLW